MSAVVKLSVLQANKIEAFDAWVTKTHRANCVNIEAFEAADKDPDTFVGGHYVRNMSDAAKIESTGIRYKQSLKNDGCSVVKEVDGTSPCAIFTYAHWAVKLRYGDVAGRLTDDQEASEYSRRGVSRNPEIRDYFQQVVRDLCDRAERMAKA